MLSLWDPLELRRARFKTQQTAHYLRGCMQQWRAEDVQSHRQLVSSWQQLFPKPLLKVVHESRVAAYVESPAQSPRSKVEQKILSFMFKYRCKGISYRLQRAINFGLSLIFAGVAVLGPRT